MEKNNTFTPRKNWSHGSELWTSGNRSITKELVNNPDVLLDSIVHRFSWLDDSDIGVVSHEWNWLTDWYKEPQDGAPKHYIIQKAVLGLKSTKDVIMLLIGY